MGQVPVHLEIIKSKSEPCVKGKALTTVIVAIHVKTPGSIYDFGAMLWQDPIVDTGECYTSFAERVVPIVDDPAPPFGILKKSSFFDLDGDGCGDLIGPAVYVFKMKKAKLVCNADGTVRPYQLCPHWNLDSTSYCKKHIKVHGGRCRGKDCRQGGAMWWG